MLCFENSLTLLNYNFHDNECKKDFNVEFTLLEFLKSWQEIILENTSGYAYSKIVNPLNSQFWDQEFSMNWYLQIVSMSLATPNSSIHIKIPLNSKYHY